MLTVLPKNASLTQTGTEGEWSKVVYNGQTGYIRSDLLAPDAAAASPAPAAVSQETEPAPAATTPAPAVTGGHIICIDPGHQRKGDSTKEPNGPGSTTMKARVTGGTRGGTTGVYEYELNLNVSLKLRDELVRRGYTVYMTRETHDINISNMERAQFATAHGAEISVRIHANGSTNTGVSGALTLTPSAGNPYIPNLAGASQKLSSCVLSSYCAATGMKNQGVQASDTMTGINWCTMPVTILEMGYMTNPADDTNMENADYQAKMVKGIADGIDAYFAS
ncbi:MAG: N-acetylmuramoyl-L-alanine amidase [Lachnospiraceae bacterium]|nr:N-acetylmuramoyl-L-alanine amidase [Lachnospiraceae bacterium]